MTFGSQSAVSAARHFNIQTSNSSALAIGLLLSTVASGAVAQTTVPGSTNTPQQEQTAAPNLSLIHI